MIGAMLSLLQEDGWILRDCGDVVSEALPCPARNGHLEWVIIYS